MTSPRLATLDEAADLLGISGRYRLRRTRRHLAALERRTGRTILVRYGGEGHGTRYRVSLPVLREVAPDLFEAEQAKAKAKRTGRSEAEEHLREWVLGHDQTHEELGERLDDLHAMITDLARQVGNRLATLETKAKR